MGKSRGRRPVIVAPPGGQVWTTPVRCVGCGEEWWHVEASEYDDDGPEGLPLELACRRCGRIGMMMKEKVRANA